MPTVGSLKVLIEGDMRPYLVTIRQAESATRGFSSTLRRSLPEAVSTANRAADASARSLAAWAAQAVSAARSVQALAVAWAGSRLVQGLNDTARAAHEAEAGATVFARMLERVGESARDVEPQLQQLAEELKVPPQIIRSNAAELLRAGYQWEQIAAIYRGAGASALLAGKSTAQGIEIATSALVSGLSTYLNQIGIVQNLSTAYQQYARELGKTADELTDAERAQAATLMITRATAQEVEDLPVLLQDYGGAVSDLDQAWYDFRVTVGSLVLPAVTATMQALTALLRPVTNLLSWLRSLRRESSAASVAMADQARRHREVADELGRLIAEYETLAGKPALSAQEHQRLQEVMQAIQRIQPDLVKGYQSLSDAIKSNLTPLRDYTEHLRRLSDEELRLAAQRAQMELPQLEAERKRLEQQRQALTQQKDVAFQRYMAATEALPRLSEMVREAQEAMQRGVPESQAFAEIDRLLKAVYGTAYIPGTSPRATFLLSLADAATKAQEEFRRTATQVEETQKRVDALTESIGQAREAIAAFERLQRGEAPFPTRPEPTDSQPSFERESLQRVAMFRAHAAYAARLESQAQVYLEQERVARLGVVRGLEAYAERLRAAGLEYESRQRVAALRAMATYAARLEGQAQVYLEQERMARLRLQRSMDAYAARLQGMALEHESTERVRMFRAMAAYSARLEAMADVYLEQERVARLKVLRGMDAYAQRLTAQALEYESQQRVAVARAMAAYAARLEGQALVYIEQERTERLKMLRGMQAYSARLQALAVEHESMERVARQRAMAAYTDRLQGQAEVYLQQEHDARLKMLRGMEAYAQRLQAQAVEIESLQRLARQRAMAAWTARLQGQADAFARQRWLRDALGRVWEGIRGEVMASIPGLAGQMVQGAVAMAPAGPLGSLAGALLPLVEQSRLFAGAMAAINAPLQQFADLIGRLLGALAPLIQAAAQLASTLIGALQPVIMSIASAIGALLVAVAPIIQILGAALAPVFGVLAVIVETLLVPALKVLFPVLKVFGLILGSVAWVIGQIWNGLISVLQAIFRALGNISIFGWKPLGFLNDWANSLEQAKMDTDSIARSLTELAGLTWEQAQATAQEIAASYELQDAAEEASEALRNVPSGFKYVLTKFGVAEPVPLQHGGIVTGPTLALVGERGPEAVVPLGSDGASLGGVTVVVQIDGPVYGMDDFDRRVQEAVSRAARRAGLADRGLARRM